MQKSGPATGGLPSRIRRDRHLHAASGAQDLRYEVDVAVSFSDVRFGSILDEVNITQQILLSRIQCEMARFMLFFHEAKFRLSFMRGRS